MLQEYRKLFHLEEVRHGELRTALLHYFGKSGQIGIRRHKFFKGGEPHFLELLFDSNDNIADIVISSGFPEPKLQEIERRIRETLIENQKTTFGQAVCFSHVPITGYFRYRDLFQIIPVPDNAPAPNMITAGYPFLLQFAYTSSSDKMLGFMRKTEKEVLYVRLLNLLLNKRIYSNFSQASHVWVLKQTKPVPSEIAQVGYSYDGLRGVVDNYSDTSSLSSIERVEPQQYYTERSYRGASALKLPSNLEATLDKALSLEGKEWDKFFMSCSWYSVSDRVVEQSSSSGFVALISAIEALIEKPERCSACGQAIVERSELCSSCEQTKFGLTKKFREFLNQNVPFLDQYPEDTKQFYKMRSSLVHGFYLLKHDLDPWEFLSDKKNEEFERYRNLHLITGVAIYNWLIG